MYVVLVLILIVLCSFLSQFADANDDEGIEQDSDDADDPKLLETKELNHILEVSEWSINLIELHCGHSVIFCYFLCLFSIPNENR